MRFVCKCFVPRATIRATSYDSAKNEYMTESEISVINFDEAKTCYMRRFTPPEDMKSVDAVACGENGEIYMIEFKNGNCSGDDIRMKIKDSVLILCDLCGKRLEDARNEIVFVLVINSESLKWYDRVAIAKANQSGTASKFCGLNKSAGFLVKKVLIFDKNELDIKLLPKLTDI